MISFQSQASKSILCPPYHPAKGNNVDIGSDFIKLPARKIDSFKMLRRCKIFPNIKRQFLEDINELKKLANDYIDEQYDNSINKFRDKINDSPDSIRDNLLPIYRETRFQIHQMVALINEYKRLEVVSHNKKSPLATATSVPFSKDGIAYILHDCLIGIDLCPDGVHSRFMRSYFGLMAAGDGLPGKLFEVRSGLLCDFIQSFLFHQKQKGAINVFERVEVHWFNSLHNLACEQLVLESIEDRFARANISDKVTGRFLSALPFAINEYSILRKLSDKLFGQLSSGLEAMGLSGLLKGPVSVEDITGAQIMELESRFVKPANLLLNVKDDDHKLDIWTVFEANDDDTYHIERCREKLMAWVTRTLLSASATVFTVLPHSKERKQLFIGTMNHLFFWVFGSDKLLSSGAMCSFDRDHHISLQLRHLKSINFSSLSMSIRFGLLTQAMEQTHQADDIMDFYLDSRICEQLKTVEPQVIEAMENLLIEKVIHCGELREKLVTNVCEYFKTSDQESSQQLQSKDAGWWLIQALFQEVRKLDKCELMVKLLLTGGCDNQINKLGNRKKTLLIQLSEKGLTEGVSYLLNKTESSINHKDAAGWTALIAAACCGHVKIVRLLLECESILFNEKSNKGRTALIEAACSGRIQIIRMLLKCEGILFNEKNNDGSTALILAAHNGHEEIVQLLIECEGILFNEKNNNGWTGLIAAARYGHVKIVRLLLECEGILFNEKRIDGWSALIVAARYGHVKIVRLLLECEGILFNEKNNDGWSALIVAARYGHEEIVRLLVECEGILFNEKNNAGWSALIVSASYGHEEIVRLLLECGDILFNEKNNDGCTALIEAARYGNEEIVRQLLECEGILLNEKSKNGWTALVVAARRGHEEIVQLLLECKGIMLNEKNNVGWTALMEAAGFGYEKIARLLLENEDILLNEMNNDGYTALALAAREGHADCVRLLVAHPAVGVNISNRGQSTPLLLAAENGHSKCVETLLSNLNVDLNKVNHFKQTALSEAIKNQHTEIVNMLRRNRRLNNFWNRLKGFLPW